MAKRARDPELEGFLALLAATRAPRTVDAYRRDLEHFAAWLKRHSAANTPTSGSGPTCGSAGRRSAVPVPPMRAAATSGGSAAASISATVSDLAQCPMSCSPNGLRGVRAS